MCLRDFKMSALFEQCVLCSLSDNLDLLGVESCPTKNEVIVTNKSRKITIYEVRSEFANSIELSDCYGKDPHVCFTRCALIIAHSDKM